MDVMAWLGVFGGGSLILSVGIAIGISKGRGKDIDALGERVHRLSNRISLFPEKPDDVYARKETMTAELTGIRETLSRIEDNQNVLTRHFIRGGAGA